MTARCVTFLFWVLAALLQGCATPHSAARVTDSPAASPRTLPHAQIDRNRDWYPWQGLLQNFEGQTVVRFRIDRAGRATDIKVVASDAAPVLQVTAVQLIQTARFDLTSVAYDPRDPAPFLVSVMFCIEHCDGRPPYPGTSDSIVIRGSRR